MILTRHTILVAALVAGATTLGACAKPPGRIAGTQIPDDPVNRALLERLEDYRLAVERRDADALVLMASPEYWEDRGTTEAKDDYGFDKLRWVLAGRFQLASEIRYSMRYDKIRRVCPGGHNDTIEKGCRAHVEVQIDASYTVNDARGEPRREDMRDQNEMVREWSGDQWMFVSGM